MKFLDWYDTNHSKLQDEFPLLKEGELIIASMKLYRQELNAKSNLDESLKVTLNDTINSPYDPNVSANSTLNASMVTFYDILEFINFSDSKL